MFRKIGPWKDEDVFEPSIRMVSRHDYVYVDETKIDLGARELKCGLPQKIKYWQENVVVSKTSGNTFSPPTPPEKVGPHWSKGPHMTLKGPAL